MIFNRAALAPGTLARRLAARITLLVGLLALSLALMSMVAIRQTMTEEMDNVLRDSVQRTFETSLRPNDPLGMSQRQYGRGIGAISIMIDKDGNERAIKVNKNGELEVLGKDVIDAFRNLPPSKSARLVLLPKDLGLYRAMIFDRPPQPVNASVRDPRDLTLVAEALPMAPVRTQTLRVLLAEVVLAAITLIVGLFIVLHTTSKLLQPLGHLSNAANAVSEMDLAQGEVEMPSKVEVYGEPTAELNQVARAFNRMLAHVSHALKAREQSEAKVRQFVADASHELRNPLAAIRGYAEITRPRRGDLPPDMVFVLERIDSESERMSHLVEDLLLLARLDTNPSLSLEDVNLSETVVEAASDARVAGPQHRWSVLLPELPVVARVDRFRVHQVITNLLANARAHTPDGTSVTIKASTEAGYAVITVTDNGPGIPAELLPNVFNRFSRSDPSRVRHKSTSSTGLGLAIVKSIIEAHEGTVSVESTNGTRFTIRLPQKGPRGSSQPLSPA